MADILNEVIEAARDNSPALQAIFSEFSEHDDEHIIDGILGEKDSKENYTPLMWAAKQGNVESVQIICDRVPSVKNIQGGWNNTTALMKAIEKRYSRSIKLIEILVEKPADLDLVDNNGMTALMLAAEQLSSKYSELSTTAVEIVKILLGKGANANKQNNDGYTALILAAQAGEYESVKAILDRPLNVGSCEEVGSQELGLEIRNKFGKTAFILAAEEGHLEIVKLLLERGADADVMSYRDMNGLQLAAVNKRVKVVRHLVESFADTLENRIKVTAVLPLACAGGNAEIVSLILSKCEFDLNKYSEAFRNACSNGSDQIVKCIIDKIADHSPDCVKQVLGEREAKDKGNTGLMTACEKGHIRAVEIIIQSIHKYELKDAGISNVLELSYFVTPNEEGNTALDLLASFYSSHERELDEFFNRAVRCNALKPYLLDMLPKILPICKSPNKIMNFQKSTNRIFEKLRNLSGIDADVQLLGALANIALALVLSAAQHEGERKDLLDLADNVQGSMVEIMNCNSMDLHENVTAVLLRSKQFVSSYNQDINNILCIVQQARCLRTGPLRDCVEHGLTKILATPQIISHLENVFHGALKSRRVEIVRTIPHIFQLRTGCSMVRFQPLVMFAMDGLSKLVFLYLVASVSICTGSKFEICGTLSLFIYRWAIWLMTCTLVLYEVGEVIDKMKSSFQSNYLAWLYRIVTAVVDHYKDPWNKIDAVIVIANILAFTATNPVDMKFWFAWSSIMLSFSLLRFIAMHKTLGTLVIMVFEMISHLFWFIVLFFICFLGFGIAFISLYSDNDELHFKTPQLTLLTLFDAALGTHPDFGKFGQKGGVVLIITFSILVGQVLINLVVARMTSGHDKIHDSSLEQWARVLALNAKEFAILDETSSLSMLPPPFNLVSVLMYVRNEWPQSEVIADESGVIPDRSVPIVSFAGTWSDRIASLLFSPAAAAYEVFLARCAFQKSAASSNEMRIAVNFLAVFLFPVWYITFLLLIWWSIFTENSTRMLPQSRRICFYGASDKDDEVDDEDVEKSAMVLETRELSLLLLLSHFLAQLVLHFLPKSYVWAFLRKSYLWDFLRKSYVWDFLCKYYAWDIYSVLLCIPFFCVFYFIEQNIFTSTPLSALSKYLPELMKSSVFISVFAAATFSSSKSIFGLQLADFFTVGIHLTLAYLLFRCNSDRTPWKGNRMVNPMQYFFPSPNVGLEDTSRDRLHTAVRFTDEEECTTGAVFHIKVIRGNLKPDGVSVFGRKVNPYVMISYGDKSWYCKPALGGGQEPQWNIQFKIPYIEDVHQDMLIEVFDKTDPNETTLIHDPEIFHTSPVDVKNWVASRRFEGILPLLRPEGHDPEYLHTPHMGDDASNGGSTEKATTPTAEGAGAGAGAGAKYPNIQLFVQLKYPQFDGMSPRPSSTASSPRTPDSRLSPRLPFSKDSATRNGMSGLRRRKSTNTTELQATVLFEPNDRTRIFKKLLPDDAYDCPVHQQGLQATSPFQIHASINAGRGLSACD